MRRFLLPFALLLSVSLAAQVPSYVPTDGLVAWYPFNGNANDESGISTDGEVFSATLTEDRFGNAASAYYFSGSGCTPHIETNIDFLGSDEGMSISFWLNRAGNGCIYPRLFGFWSGSNSPQSWGMAWGNSAVLDYMGTIPPNNEWHHVAVSLTSDSIHAYLNGELMGSVASGKQPPLASFMSIGRMTHPAYDAFNGSMDDFAIYNRVLTNEEVTGLYQSSSVEESCYDFSEVPTEVHLDNGPVTLQLGPGESSPQADSDGVVVISEPGLFVLERSVGDAHLSLVQDSSWVDFGDILNDLTPPASFSFDVRLTGNGGPILATDNGNPSYYNGYWISLNTNQLTCSFGDGGWHGGGERRTGRIYSDFAQNEWYHLTCVVNGANDFTFYLDGIEQSTSYNDAGFGGPVNFTTDPMKLGHHNADSPGTGARYDQCFSGDLNNVTVWHRALSGAEAMALQEGGLPEDLTALVAHWDFNGTTGGVVLDGSGLGHDGQLMGNATISTTPLCTITDNIVVDHAGCTDEAACNYDAAAATNDGSCNYTQEADYGLDPTLLACAPGVTLSAPAGLSGYTWSDGSTGSELSVSESGTYTLSTSEGESTGCGLEFEQGDYAALNQPISVDSDGYALRARVHFPLPPTECPPGSMAHNQIMSSANPVEWTPLGIRQNGQLTIYWNQNGYHWIESGYNTDALTGWHTVGVVLNGGMAEFYVDDEQVGSAAFTLPASATLQNLGNYIPTYWNSCQPIGQLDYVQLWLPDGNGQVDATPWDGVTPNHQWDLDCGNATGATQGTVDLTLQGSPEEITFNTACQSTDAVVVTINQNCVTTEFCGEGTTWDEDLGQCVPTVTDVPSAASCGAGTHWDPVTEMCIADVPGTTDENCTVMNLQELAEGYQILLTQNAELDSLLADCNGTASEAASNGCADENSVMFDGHDYDLVEIGDQCWFAENLQTEHYANGDLLEGDLSDGEWSSITSGAQAVRNNDDSNLPSRGRLYNWAAVADTRGLCPSGWHIPTDSEWKTLELELGMPLSEVEASGERGSNEGQALKASPSDSPSWNGNNSSGFNAYPGGARDNNGGYYAGTSDSFMWTSTPFNENSAWIRDLDSDTSIERYNWSTRYGFSVRCVKD